MAASVAAQPIGTAVRHNPTMKPRLAHSALALATLAVMLAGCGLGASPATPIASETDPDVPKGPPDSPAALDREGAMLELVAYGEDHRDTFGGLYIDPPGGTSVVMLFTADIETHRDAVNEILPGTRVRQVRFTEAELRAFMETIVDADAFSAQGIEFVSASVDTSGNRVELDVKSNDPTVELRLEAIHGGILDVTVHPIPGEWHNVASGEGWRLVDVVRAHGNEAYLVRAATDPQALAVLWKSLGTDAERPEIDFEREILVTFAHGLGSSCPELRLDGVAIEDGLVYSRTSDPLAPRACTADLVAAEMFVVALDRDALPGDGFTLRLRPDDLGESLEVTLP
jgi:hypothetical protein